MKPITIAGIGELLWDILPSGEKLGGAPVNFAYHVGALGAEGFAISTVGDDNRGRRAIAELQLLGMDTSCISSAAEYPTGFVDACLDSNGVAAYTFPDDVAWDHLVINAAAAARAGRLDAICFGTLAQRSAPTRLAIHNYVKAMPGNALRICDLNLRQRFYTPQIIDASLALCSILKLNEEELSVLSGIYQLTGPVDERLRRLRDDHNLEMVILTQGPQGSLLLTDTRLSRSAGKPATVVDTVGAGDSFTAAVVIGLLLGRDLDELHETAARLAAYVCGQAGAMPAVPEHCRYADDASAA